MTTEEVTESFAKLRAMLCGDKPTELSREHTYICQECGYEQTFRYPKNQQLFCPFDHSPMMPKMELNARINRPKELSRYGLKITKDRWGDNRDPLIKWRATPLGEIQKKQFSRELTARIKGMKQFQSYPKTPQEEKHSLIRTAIGATGVAAGLAGAGFALRGTVGKAQRADIAREAVNRVVRAQRAAKATRADMAAASAAAAEKASKAKRKDRYRAASASFTAATKNPNLSKGEKAAFKRAHAHWKEANPGKEFSDLLRRLKQFDAPIIVKEKRDLLSKLRDAAGLTASVGAIGALGYGGYRAHGLFNQISKEIPKAAETFHANAPGVAKAAKETMGKVGEAAEGIRATAASIKKGPIADGAPDLSRIPFIGKKYFDAFDGQQERRRSIVAPLLAGAALGAGAVAIPHVVRGARRIEKVAKASARKVGTAADNLKKTQSNVQHSTSIYADLGKLYKEAKGGLYNIFHPVNTWKETKAAYKAGTEGKATYKTRPRPEWAMSARLRIKEFANHNYYDPRQFPGEGEHLESETGGIPLNGRVAHDRFIKQIHEGDLDRRDRNATHAAIAGGAAGFLSSTGAGKTISSKINRGALGAVAGAGGVLAIRAATNRHRDIYGDRPRWAKTAEAIPTVAGAGAVAALLAKRAKMFDDPTKKPLNPALKAGLAGALAGGVIGGIPALKEGSKLIPSLKSIGAGAAGLGGLVGGGVAVGDKILGAPQNNEAAPFTKRAALGGALLGTAAGAGAVIAAKKIPAAAKFIDSHSEWRPVNFIKNASLPAATLAGAGVGGVIGAEKASDEGQQVDVINSIQKQKQTLFSRIKEFQLPAYAPAPYRNYDEVKDARRQAFQASAVAGAVGIGAASLIGHGLGRKAQFKRDFGHMKGAFKRTEAWKKSAADFQKQRNAATDAAQRANNRAQRMEQDAQFWKNEAASRGSRSGGATGAKSYKSSSTPPPRGAKGTPNPHAGTPKAEKWEKWQSMKRTAAESNYEGERANATAAADKWQKKYNLSRQIQSTLKEFGFYNQPRRAGESMGTDKQGNPRWSRERGTFADPVHSSFGLEGDLMPNVDAKGRDTPASFGQAQMVRGFYNKGKNVHRWGTRAGRLASDVGDVFAGNPRSRDASGRPQKREWEKSWFKNATGAAAAGAGLAGLGFVTSKTDFGKRHILPKIKRAVNAAAGQGWRLSARIPSVKFFDEWAAYNGWDVRDPRGKSARVFAPGSRARIRREKEWHETKENRDKLHLIAGLTGVGIAGLGAAALTRKSLGHPIVPDAVSKIFREPVLSAEEHQAKAAFHAEAAKSAAAGGNIRKGPWKPKNNPPR